MKQQKAKLGVKRNPPGFLGIFQVLTLSILTQNHNIDLICVLRTS